MQDQVNYYKTYYFSSGNYDCLVVCLSYVSIFNYIKELQHELNKKNVKNGKILFDQLLITGNKNNRFLSIDFKDGLFIMSSAKNINAEQKYHQLTSAELRNNISQLKNSILSKRQISMIKKGCIL